MLSTLTEKQKIAAKPSEVDRRGFPLTLQNNRRYQHILRQMQSNAAQDLRSLKKRSSIQVLSIGCGLLAPELYALKALLPNTSITCIAVDYDEDIIKANQSIYARKDAQACFADNSITFVASDIQHYAPDNKFDLILWTGIESTPCLEPPTSEDPQNTSHIFGGNSINHIMEPLINRHLNAHGVFFLTTNHRFLLELSLTRSKSHGEILKNSMADVSYCINSKAKHSATVACAQPHMATLLLVGKPAAIKSSSFKSEAIIATPPPFYSEYSPYLLFGAVVTTTICTAYAASPNDEETEASIKNFFGWPQ